MVGDLIRGTRLPNLALGGRFPGTPRVCTQVPPEYVLGYPQSTYPGTPRVCTRVPPEYVRGYPQSMYPGTPRVCTRVPPEYVIEYPQSTYPGIPRVCTRVPPEYVPGYHQSIYPGITRVSTRLPPEYVPGHPQSMYPGIVRVYTSDRSLNFSVWVMICFVLIFSILWARCFHRRGLGRSRRPGREDGFYSASAVCEGEYCSGFQPSTATGRQDAHTHRAPFFVFVRPCPFFHGDCFCSHLCGCAFLTLKQ